MTLTKKLENKYFLDSIRDERILTCEDGYRLFTITVKDCTQSEGTKLSELLVELYSEEVPMYIYDYEYYNIYDEYFEFQVCVDEEMLKEFNELYKEFKKSAKELLNKENEKMLNDDSNKLLVDEIEEDQKEEKTNFKFEKIMRDKNSGDEGFRLITIIIKNCELEDYKELLDDLLKSASNDDIRCYQYDCIEAGISYKTCQCSISVDENKLRLFVETYRRWVDGWTDTTIPENREDIIKGVFYNTTTEQNKNIAKYKIGQILYNHGDMANVSGWYKITDVTIDKFGIFYKVEEIGGDRKNTYHEVFINDKDNNNGSTRIVTFEARSKIVGLDNAKRQIELLTRNSQEEEIENITSELVETCLFGINIEKEIRIYFNRLAKDQRTKVINKFQRDKKSVDINLFYCSTFLDSYPYNLEELQELRSKIVKYLNFITDFKDSVIEEVNNYQEQIRNFKKEPLTDNETIEKLKEIFYEEKKERQNEFEYTFRNRGFSPGCQPIDGLIKHETRKGFHYEVLTYNRKLSEEEISNFELLDMNYRLNK